MPHRLWRRPRRRAAAAAPLAAAMLALTGCGGTAIAQATPLSNGQSFVQGSAGTTVYGASGPRAPDVVGTTLAGRKFRLSSYRGHVVVLNFWGSWCTPCRAEAPALASLSHRFHAQGVRFLGVDIRDSKAAAMAFMRDFHITYPSLNDPGDQVALDFRHTVPPTGIPTTLVVGRHGRIAARVIGEVTYGSLKGLISRAVAGTS